MLNSLDRNSSLYMVHENRFPCVAECTITTGSDRLSLFCSQILLTGIQIYVCAWKWSWMQAWIQATWTNWNSTILRFNSAVLQYKSQRSCLISQSSSLIFGRFYNQFRWNLRKKGNITHLFREQKEHFHLYQLKPLWPFPFEVFELNKHSGTLKTGASGMENVRNY